MTSDNDDSTSSQDCDDVHRTEGADIDNRDYVQHLYSDSGHFSNKNLMHKTENCQTESAKNGKIT